MKKIIVVALLMAAFMASFAHAEKVTPKCDNSTPHNCE